MRIMTFVLTQIESLFLQANDIMCNLYHHVWMSYSCCFDNYYYDYYYLLQLILSTQHLVLGSWHDWESGHWFSSIPHCLFWKNSFALQKGSRLDCSLENQFLVFLPHNLCGTLEKASQLFPVGMKDMLSTSSFEAAFFLPSPRYRLPSD